MRAKQVKNELKKFKIGEKIRILDYGAGKGRLADAMYYSDDIEKKADLHQWFNYIAFDPYISDKQFCEAAISRIYNSKDKRYYNNETYLLEDFGENSFDVIVMCNVLHEIPPKEWLNIFSSNGVIVKLLKSDGYLLLVEDQLIPIGEKPHQNGFIVLDLLQLKEIFKITEEDSTFKYSDARNDRRLMSYQIPKQCLGRITSDSRRKSLEGTVVQSKKEIKILRAKESNYKNGKLHGFWTQQLANALICLDEF